MSYTNYMVPTTPVVSSTVPGYYTPSATTVSTTLPTNTGHPLDGAKQVATVEPKNSSSYKTVGIIIGIVVIIIIVFLLFTYLFGWGRGGAKGHSCDSLNDPSCSGGTACSGNKTCEPSGSLGGNGSSCSTSANCLYGYNCQQVTNGNGTTPTGKYVCTPANTVTNIPTNRTPALVPHTSQSESNTFRSTAPTPANTNNNNSCTTNTTNGTCCCSWSPHTCPLHRRSGNGAYNNRYGYW